MIELSIIIPYCNEWPQIAFTIRGIAEALTGVDFEIIAVDNWNSDIEVLQGRLPDRGHDRLIKKGEKTIWGIYGNHPTDAELTVSHIKNMSKKHTWLKYVKYDEKLSHWNAKRVGVAEAKGRFLWFMDAHVLPSANLLKESFEYYSESWKDLDGSLHLPLAYHILESDRLIYRPMFDLPKSDYHYKFQTLSEELFPSHVPFEVPCMSTCGMLIEKSIYDYVGGWPEQLGIYGGGENFMNFSLAVVGKKKWIWSEGTLYHHGDQRGYNWNKVDYDRNRVIATYLFGGESEATIFAMKCLRGNDRQKRVLLDGIFDNCFEQRDLIAGRTVETICEYAKRWKNKW